MNKNRLWEDVTSVEWPIRFVGVVYGILKGIVEMLPKFYGVYRFSFSF